MLIHHCDLLHSFLHYFCFPKRIILLYSLPYWMEFSPWYRCHLDVFIPTFFMFTTYIGPHVVLFFFNLRMISPLRINAKALFLLIILIFNNETGLSFLEYFSVCVTSGNGTVFLGEIWTFCCWEERTNNTNNPILFLSYWPKMNCFHGHLIDRFFFQAFGTWIFCQRHFILGRWKH